MKLYHGTPTPHAVLRGIDLSVPRLRDPGDFGWGFYCTMDPARARTHGDVLIIAMDVSRFALIPDPYRETGLETPEEKLFHRLAFEGDQMLTVVGSRRQVVAKTIQCEFLRRGWLGIFSERHAEAVAFDASVVQSVQPWPNKATKGA